MSKKVLITGFEPFRQHKVNSSWEACRIVGESMPDQVVARRLPVEYHEAHTQLIAQLTELTPAVCLCTGLTSAAIFGIERVARKPFQFNDIPREELLEGAWKWEQIETVLRSAQIPYQVSYNAGRYVCESTYWTLLNRRKETGYPEWAAFLHVPPLSEQIPAEKIADLIRQIIRSRIGIAE
jgi:pyroglutamyl-peptidase